ncbi:tyrosine-type recombinase/integrase [Pseudomonas aeruginosa]|uniref:tyrosine-type recombinase/integrase n=1 Tax=Pseudomonas aeruginosa TaxID=287 RepID=UPI001D5E2F79|nr:tyrosine-type recombinase/integrase [Pseudomonas aeruginosa]
MSVPTHQQDLIALLEERGFVHQCTDRDGLAAHLAAGPATAYLGFDATADSLHVGHLQGLMLMRWLQKAGHRPLLLIGGATTRIGDPSFRDSSRPILTEAQIQANIDGIARVFSRYVELDKTKNGDARKVPLSSRAVTLFQVLVDAAGKRQNLFTLTSGSADTLFRKVRDRQKIDGLNFHDTRHEATTRLARKLDVLDLARMTGHRDPRSLMVYYNATATEVASRLG